MTPPQIDPPTVDEVCQHIRDTWPQAEPIDSWVMVQAIQITEAEMFAQFEQQARDDLWTRAGRQFRAVITPGKADWIAAPRLPDSLAPDLQRGKRIEPALDAIPPEIRNKGFLICMVAALALPVLGLGLPLLSNEAKRTNP